MTDNAGATIDSAKELQKLHWHLKLAQDQNKQLKQRIAELEAELDRMRMVNIQYEDCSECDGQGYWEDTKYINCPEAGPDKKCDCKQCDNGMRTVDVRIDCPYCDGEGKWEV